MPKVVLEHADHFGLTKVWWKFNGFRSTFYRWKQKYYLLVTPEFQTSELHQINLLTIQEVADWAKVSTKTVSQSISIN